MRLKMISNLIVLISFSALVSLGVCKPSDLPNNSKQLYTKCLPQVKRFQTFISCEEELKEIKFTSDALNYVCLLSLNVILEACKYDDLLPKINDNLRVKPINQTCPIIYVAKYDNLKYDLHEGINYLRDRERCEALCSYSEDSLLKCSFLKEVIEIVNEYHTDELSQGKIPAVHDPVSAEKKNYEDIRNPDNVSHIHVGKDLKNETGKDLSQGKTQSDGIASSYVTINQATKTENTNKMNKSKTNSEILNSNIEMKFDDNKKDNANIDENKFSNNEKNSSPKLLADSAIENSNSYKLPGKDDEQSPMPVSNPIDANTNTLQTESGSFGDLNKNINVNNHEKDYRNDGSLADEGGGGGDGDDDDDDINGPAAAAAAVAANSVNNANNNNNNDVSNNFNEDDDMGGMQDALLNREPPQWAKNLNSKEVYSSNNFFQAEDSHFSTYFLMTISLIIIGYIIYHNKNKIVAYALEGRRNRSGRRRAASSASYRKLDCNLEEAIASNPSHASVTNVVY